MKKKWGNVLAVLGIALLAAAVALMPACDTSESCDLDLETLNGDWQVTVTPNEGSPQVMLMSFEVAGDTLIVTIPPEGYPGDPTIQEMNLDCSGDKVRLYLSEPIEAFEGLDCEITQTQSISVKLISPDSFSGTQRQSVSLSGADCQAIIDLLKITEPEAYEEYLKLEQGVTSQITGTRI